MTTITHSDKALETINLTGTRTEDWGLTEIKWVKEKVRRMVQEDCKVCYGHGRTYVYEGKAISHEGIMKLLKSKFKIERTGCLWGGDAEKVGAAYEACPACKTTRTRYASSGKVWVLKLVDTWVGYVQWAKGTRFDSRFAHNDCQLCSKTLQKAMNGDGYFRRVPVTAKGPDGVIHGMWVGPDCGRKFFGIKNFKDDRVIKVEEAL